MSVGLVTSWELLGVDDVGPGEADGTRRVKVHTVAHGPGDTTRLVDATVEVRPELFEEWLSWATGRLIRP